MERGRASKPVVRPQLANVHADACAATAPVELHAASLDDSDAPAAAPVDVPSGDELLARFHARALGPAVPGCTPADPRHRDVRARAAAVLAGIDAQPERLPRRPQLLPALMRATGSGDASSMAIATLVEQDPTLTGNVLRIANSAAYRVRGAPLDSVARAVTRLGTEGMRRIIAASLMQPVTDGKRGAFAAFPAAIWEHSLMAAAAAADCALGLGAGAASRAHMAALVHGLGSIVVVHAVRDEYLRDPTLAPDAAVAAGLLDQAGAIAVRIAASWGLGEAMPIPGAATTHEPIALSAALHTARCAAAAQVLVAAGALDEAVAIASLAAVSGRPDTWTRLQRLHTDE